MRCVGRGGGGNVCISFGTSGEGDLREAEAVKARFLKWGGTPALPDHRQLGLCPALSVCLGGVLIWDREQAVLCVARGD